MSFPRSSKRTVNRAFVLAVVLIVIALALAMAHLWRHASDGPVAQGKSASPPSSQAGLPGGATDTGPLGPSGKQYTVKEAQASIPPSRLVLPQTTLASNDEIDAIWATDGQDAETWIQYRTGVVLTEQVPSWDLTTATPRPSSAPTDVASFGHAMLSDGGGMIGEVTKVDGQDAFVAYASDPSHAQGPGSVVVQVDGSVDSIIGTTSTVTMEDLSAVTSAVISSAAYRSPGQ
jgi:hypothetical protein